MDVVWKPESGFIFLKIQSKKDLKLYPLSKTPHLRQHHERLWLPADMKSEIA